MPDKEEDPSRSSRSAKDSSNATKARRGGTGTTVIVEDGYNKWHEKCKVDDDATGGCCAPPYCKIWILDCLVFGTMLGLSLAHMLILLYELVGPDLDFYLTVRSRSSLRSTKRQSDGLVILKVLCVVLSLVFVIFIVGLFVCGAIYHLSGKPSLMSLYLFDNAADHVTWWGTIFMLLAVLTAIADYAEAGFKIATTVILSVMLIFLIIAWRYNYYRYWDLNEAHGRRFGEKLIPFWARWRGRSTRYT